jgi:hypothetical protein
MAGKKWCEYCRLNLNYNKKDIQDHEATQTHIKNKANFVKFERIKFKMEEKQKRLENASTALLSTANIPKAKKGS